jgi:hypothetical protein
MSPVASRQPPPRRASAPRAATRKRLAADPSPLRRCRKLLAGRPLAVYVDDAGRRRELLTLPGFGDSTLVLDRDAATLCDRRLVAHLAADEPTENAALVCTRYLEDESGRWCRRVQPDDLLVDPLAEDLSGGLQRSVFAERLVDDNGDVYHLGLLQGERSTAQLRWCRRAGGALRSGCEQVVLRDVIAKFESYEPVRTFTEHAIACHGDDPNLLVTRLRSEFERLCASPVVLNRGLREAVLQTIDQRGLSMSEIALRCGMVKRDRHGKTSGETSWVARRIGVMPEGGEKEVTPWVHIDVLAVIARKGLGVSPREVELQ